MLFFSKVFAKLFAKKEQPQLPVVIKREMTQEYARQALNQKPWACSDCAVNFSTGMPDTCLYNQPWCNKVIKRDKAEAKVVMAKLEYEQAQQELTDYIQNRDTK